MGRVHKVVAFSRSHLLQPLMRVFLKPHLHLAYLSKLSTTSLHFHLGSMNSIDAVQHDRDLDLAVIGGGLAGLTLSIALTNFGVKHTVYEGANCFSDLGAGISTGKNAIAALTLIDPRIIECYDRCAPLRCSPGGSHLPHMSFRWGMAQKHPDGLEQVPSESRSSDIC